MIIPVSLRDNHPEDMKIIAWYNGLMKSERSREIRKILYSHINPPMHTMKLEIGNNPLAEKERIDIKPVDIVREEKKVDLDSKLDNLGGGLFD